jgi:membrane-bound acyltransferase YfiQ involved in biofilm formation
VHYIFCFYAGILAYRGNWLERLSEAQARRWGIVSLVVIPFVLVITLAHVLLGGSLEGFGPYVMGGLHWQAFAYAVWETILMIGIITWLLYIFRKKLNRSGPTTKKMAGNAYTVYIVHQTIVTALAIVIVSVAIPTIIKFAIVSLIAVPLCFAISHLIRKAPYTNRVLG